MESNMEDRTGATNYANATVDPARGGYRPDEVYEMVKKAYLAGRHSGIGLIGRETANFVNRTRDPEPIEGLY
jgi:hypothetical protein